MSAAPFDIRPFIVNIVPNATYKGRKLAAAVDLGNPSGQLVVQLYDPTQISQQFLPVHFCDPNNGLPVGIAFLNLLSGQAMCYGGGEGAPVVQRPVSQLDAWSTWTLAPTGWGGSGYCAVRPAYIDSQNLNIPGDGPYPPGTGLITWEWGDQDPQSNDVWAFIRTSPDYSSTDDPIDYAPLPRYLQSWARLVLTRGDNGAYQAFYDKSAATQKYLPLAWFDHSSGKPNGTIFVNLASGKAVRADAYATQLQEQVLTSIGNELIWTMDGQTGGYLPIRRSDTGNMYMNIRGDSWPEGTPVITWEWGDRDPQQNDVWQCRKTPW